MKINIEARLKNKVFLISMSVLLISIIYKVLSLFWIAPSVDEHAILMGRTVAGFIRTLS